MTHCHAGPFARLPAQYAAWKTVRDVLGKEAVAKWEANNPALAALFKKIEARS